MLRPHRRHPLWLAFILHRISGLLLALFLPAHFWVLSLALREETRLDGFLAWTENPLLKLAEIILVFLLAIHFFGGLRLLAMEWLPWSSTQKTWAAMAAGVSLFIAATFLIQAV